jgi:hypothetical protein
VNFDFRGGSRRPQTTRLALLAALLALAFAAGAGTPSPAAAGDDGSAVTSAPAAPATVTPPVTDPAAEALGPVVPAEAGPGAPGARARRRLSPMAAELAQVIDAERSALTVLQARFDHATSEHEALAVQREIEQLKTMTEIALLHVQAKHARLKGREAVARRIDAAVEELMRPPLVRDPLHRPAPAEVRTER